MKFIKKIKLIRILEYISLLIAALLLTKGNYLMAILSLVVGWQITRMHRCPFCKKYIDMRLKINEMEYCNNCGEKLDIIQE